MILFCATVRDESVDLINDFRLSLNGLLSSDSLEYCAELSRSLAASAACMGIPEVHTGCQNSQWSNLELLESYYGF